MLDCELIATQLGSKVMCVPCTNSISLPSPHKRIQTSSKFVVLENKKKLDTHETRLTPNEEFIFWVANFDQTFVSFAVEVLMFRND